MRMNEFVKEYKRKQERTTLLRQTREWYMPPRRDWNAIGVPVPAWFRHRLKLIDPNLVLQYMPPAGIVKGGVDPTQYPYGAWVVMRKMKRTGWLHKKWVYSLTDERGMPKYPTHDVLVLIRAARNLYRSGNDRRLQDQFDRNAHALACSRTRKTRERLIEGNIEAMRRLGLTSHPGRPMVAVPS